MHSITEPPKARPWTELRQFITRYRTERTQFALLDLMRHAERYHLHACIYCGRVELGTIFLGPVCGECRQSHKPVWW